MLRQYLDKAQKLIDLDDPLIYNIARVYGQIVDNVKHTAWFVEAVAEELIDESTIPTQ